MLGLGRFAAPSPGALARCIRSHSLSLSSHSGSFRQTERGAALGGLLLALLIVYHPISSSIRILQLPPAEAIASAGFVLALAFAAAVALVTGARAGRCRS